MSPQLLLPLQKKTLLRFADFYPSGNPLVFNTLQNWPLDSRMIFLKGEQGAGKTHLCEATAEFFLSQGKEVLFLSGKTAPPPPYFYELPNADCFILDDIDALLSFSSQYEEALFALYNQIFDRPHAYLLFTSNLAIEGLPLRLQDLKSRLQSMLQLNLKALNSIEDLKEVLNLHAKRLEIEVPSAVFEYWLNHLPRKPDVQIETLTRTAEQALKDKKPLTLAYARKHLAC